jgi:hypothetical protein
MPQASGFAGALASSQGRKSGTNGRTERFCGWSRKSKLTCRSVSPSVYVADESVCRLADSECVAANVKKPGAEPGFLVDAPVFPSGAA